MADTAAACAEPFHFAPPPAAALEAAAAALPDLVARLSTEERQAAQFAADAAAELEEPMPSPTSSAAALPQGLNELLGLMFAAQPMLPPEGTAALAVGEGDGESEAVFLEMEEGQGAQLGQEGQGLGGGSQRAPKKGTAAWYHSMRYEPVIPGSEVSGEKQCMVLIAGCLASCWGSCGLHFTVTASPSRCLLLISPKMPSFVQSWPCAMPSNWGIEQQLGAVVYAMEGLGEHLRVIRAEHAHIRKRMPRRSGEHRGFSLMEKIAAAQH